MDFFEYHLIYTIFSYIICYITDGIDSLHHES